MTERTEKSCFEIVFEFDYCNFCDDKDSCEKTIENIHDCVEKERKKTLSGR